ncbi:sulfate transporter CysZ [Kaarinaea lacus]
MDNPLAGIKYLLKGLRLITSPGLRRFVIIPLLINTTLFVVAIWLGFEQIGIAVDWLMAKLPDWLQWLSWLFYLMFGLICLLFVFFTFSLLANIVAAPFNDLLCTAVMKKLKGGNLPDNINQPGFIQQILPSVLNELKKFAYFAGWSIPFLILLVIPGVNVIGTVLWFLFSAWMLNVEYMDYPMSQNKLDFTQQRALFKQRKIISYSFGSVVSVATMIPVANFLVMPAAVAGATALWIEQYEK